MRGAIKLGVVGFLIGAFLMFWSLYLYEQRNALDDMSPIVVMGLMWAGMAVAIGTKYNRTIRGAVLGFCMWAVLTFWLMPGPEPSSVIGLLIVPDSDPDGTLVLVARGSMWAVAGALIGNVSQRAAFNAGPYQRTYDPRGLSAGRMSLEWAVAGAVVGFSMGAFISGLWNIGLAAPEGLSYIESMLMMTVTLAAVGACMGSIAGLKRWYKRALVGAILTCMLWMGVVVLFDLGLFGDSEVRDTMDVILTGNPGTMMDAIEESQRSILNYGVLVLLIGSLGAMLGGIAGINKAPTRVLVGFTVLVILALLAPYAIYVPIISAAYLDFSGLTNVEVLSASFHIVHMGVLVGVIGAAIALGTGGSVRQQRYG